MRLIIKKSELFKLLSRTQNVVEKRNTMHILTHILLDAKNKHLQIYGTDLEVSVTAQSEADIKEEGKTVVSSRNLFDIIKELPDGDIHLAKTENNSLEIKQGKALFHINGMTPEEFPIFPSYTTKDFSTLEQQVLKEMIDKTIYSVSNDNTRYHLNGVYFERSPDTDQSSLRMVATDGHRLSCVDRDLPQVSPQIFSGGVIVPRKGLYEVKKMVESLNPEETSVDIAVDGAQLILKTKDSVLMVRLIDGKYPNYQQLIPQNLKSHITVNRETFLASLKRVSLLSNQKSKGVTFSFTEGKMEIFSNSPDLGDAREEIDVDYSGEKFKIGFNARYILDVLNSFAEEDVKLSFSDQLSPGLLSPMKDQDYRCVVMPMRI